MSRFGRVCNDRLGRRRPTVRHRTLRVRLSERDSDPWRPPGLAVGSRDRVTPRPAGVTTRRATRRGS